MEELKLFESVFEWNYIYSRGLDNLINI